MRTWNVLAVVLAIIVVPAAMAFEANSSSYSTNRTVTDAGGLSSSSDNFISRAGIGQVAIGITNTSDSRICSGVFCNVPVVVTAYAGNNTVVKVFSAANISIRFFDADNNTYPGGVNGTIWLEDDSGNFLPHSCTSNSSGVCSASIPTDCDIGGGIRRFIGGVRGDDYYEDVNMTTTGFIIVDSPPRCGVTADTATFSMDFNIGSNDVTQVGSASSGFFTGNNRFGCVYNPSITGQPSIGVVSAGESFRHVNLSNVSSATRIEVSEFLEGNRFIIPVTTERCDVISRLAPDITNVESFTSFVEKKTNPLEIVISYPTLDIEGNVTARGSFVLSIAKSGTGKIVVSKG